MYKSFFDSYASYYKTGLYTSRYQDSIPSRCFYAVVNTILATHRKKRPESYYTPVRKNQGLLKVLDYGCGDGRYFDVFKYVAATLKKDSVYLEITGVDPIKEALSNYKNKLTDQGFSVVEYQGFNDIEDKFATHICTLENPDINIRVRLVQNHPEGDLIQESAIIGRQDCGVCMFGVLSHIPVSDRRIETMKILSSITAGTLLFTLPNARRCFLEEQKELGSKDIFYTRNKNVRIFYHLYTKNEIESDIHRTNAYIINSISSANIFDETTLVRSKLIDIIDWFISENMPSYFVEYFCRYFLFEIQCEESEVEKKMSL